MEELVIQCTAKLMTCRESELSNTDGQYLKYYFLQMFKLLAVENFCYL